MTETTANKLSQAELEAAHSRAIHSRALLTGRRGCFYCLSTFLAERATQWADDDDTALCPVCGIDAVLSAATDSISPEALEQMHDRWFETSAIEDHAIDLPK